jgi:hypothetical protein
VTTPPRPYRRWLIGFSAEPSLMPRSMRAEAREYAGRPYRDTSRPCWTYKSARRLARRWNNRPGAIAQPGTWEAFGPLGKGEGQ